MFELTVWLQWCFGGICESKLPQAAEDLDIWCPKGTVHAGLLDQKDVSSDKQTGSNCRV